MQNTMLPQAKAAFCISARDSKFPKGERSHPMSKRSDRVHPAVPEVQEQLRQGRISRREFLRVVTLLGVSASSAYVMAACGGAPQQPGSAAAPTLAPAAGAPTAAPAPAAAAGAIKRGGVLRVGISVP